MAKLKPPTAQDLCRQRKKCEEEEKYTHSWRFVLKACVSHFDLAFGRLTCHAYIYTSRSVLGTLCRGRCPRVFEDNTGRDADGRTRHPQNRQPPPKKRRRATLTPADPSAPLSPAPPLSPIINEEDKLISFVDMIFGGQPTSILVCQKCKHISRTYEDFNNISLGMKPEDYTH